MHCVCFRSICLFHAKFGTECLAAEFTDTRPTASPDEQADESSEPSLGGHVDESDARLFDAVHARWCDELSLPWEAIVQRVRAVAGRSSSR